MLVAPFAWRPLLVWLGPDSTSLQPSNLPVLEAARERYPFDATPIADLQATRPAYVVLGDSMSDRILPSRVTELTGKPAMSLMRLATGAAHWYLLYKNYLVASGIPPARVVVFFRDTQITDPLYRLVGKDRFSIDTYAHDREDELNAVVAANVDNTWFRFHNTLDRVLLLERTRDWLEPALTRAVTAAAAGHDEPDAFTGSMNRMFALDRLRVMTADDMGEIDDASTDFDARVERSTLPLIIGLAKARGDELIFVRVLRRPDDQGRPPRESAALRRYAARVRAYVTAQGARFFDDREDAAFGRLTYADGDHIADSDRAAYTDLFLKRLEARP